MRSWRDEISLLVWFLDNKLEFNPSELLQSRKVPCCYFNVNELMTTERLQ